MFSNTKRKYCVQSVLGISIPVETKDKVNWRTMNLGVNFQAQFIPIPTIIYPWTRFERSMIHQKKQFLEHGTYVADESRQFVYSAFEILMDRLKYINFIVAKAISTYYFQKGQKWATVFVASHLWSFTNTHNAYWRFWWDPAVVSHVSIFDPLLLD